MWQWRQGFFRQVRFLAYAMANAITTHESSDCRRSVVPTPKLRELYSTLSLCSTNTHRSICADLLRVRKNDAPGRKLADLFQGALTSRENTGFDARQEAFVPGDRKGDRGTNPTTNAMKKAPGQIMRAIGGRPYGFRYHQREVPILRKTTAGRHPAGKAWIDCVGMSDAGRPVLGEIKWGSDKNAFYGFIQLLTYLTEIGTPNQIARARRHNLFGTWAGETIAHDLVILLVNAKRKGKKWNLMKDTESLAVSFVDRLRMLYPEAAAVLGNIVCLYAQVDEHEETFAGELETLWFVEG